ncbi:MAG: DUF4097 family beta strand repeat protein [Clostridia bacterium]|nr:DUF4097 family beta strand repeat protein [Clostridia bacterium]
MSKRTKTWLIIAASLVLVGGIIFTGVMTVLKWDFTKLSTSKYYTNSYEINQNYENISIISDTADILFLPAKNSKSSVICYEQKNIKHSVAVKDETLEIEIVDNRKWYEHIGINFGTPKITIYIPQGEYGALSVKSSTSNVETPKSFKFESIDISVSTGDIRVEDVSADLVCLSVSTGEIIANGITCEGDFKVNVSTGDAKLEDIKCKNIISNGDTGDISLKNVIAKETFSIERSAGDVKFEDCDADEIFVKTDTGSVRGNLLTDKVFITKSDTGYVDVPNTVTGGKCEIITDTGNIKIDIK